MSEVTQNDVLKRLECMKNIIQGDQTKDIEEMTECKENDDPPCLVDADGKVNDQAKEKLSEHVNKTIEALHELFNKTMHEQGEQQDRGRFKGNAFSPGNKELQLLLPKSVRTSENFNPALAAFFKKFSFKIVIVEEITILKGNLPLFVVCPLSTRIEPDIDHVIGGLNWKTTYAVLIVHSGLEYALPQMATTRKLHGNAKYSNIEFIDVAFSEERGFYSTEMNTKARKLIKEFADKSYM